jgi:hypothetical protein
MARAEGTLGGSLRSTTSQGNFESLRSYQRRLSLLQTPPLSTLFGHKITYKARSITRPRPHTRGIYLFWSLTATVGFGWMLERAVAGGETFSLVCLGFFGSRPLRANRPSIS